MRRIFLMLVLLGNTCPMLAQAPNPDAVALLQELRQNTGDWQTIQYEVETGVAVGFTGSWNEAVNFFQPGNLLPGIQIRVRIALQKPNSIRIEVKQTTGAESGRALTLISDGETAWIYSSRRKQYARITRPLSPMELLSNLDFLLLGEINAPFPYDFRFPTARSVNLLAEFMPVADLMLADMKETPMHLQSETIKVDGKNRECWVLTSRAQNLSKTVWFDKSLRIPVRVSFGSVKSLKIDKPISAATFRFAPPKGAKEVQSR